MKIITVAMQKGGTGKTTTAAALAQAAHLDGKKVLAVDLDPQSNLSYALAGKTGTPGSYELITDKDAPDPQTTAQGIDLYAGSWDLSTITTGKGSARRLQTAIQPLKDKYDLIIIDTPPTAGEMLYNALQTSTALIIPLTADIYGLQALEQILDTARQIRQSNPELSVAGYIFTQYNPRAVLTKHMTEVFRGTAASAGVEYLGSVRQGIAIREAAALQQSLYEYAPKSNPAIDYQAIYQTIMSR